MVRRAFGRKVQANDDSDGELVFDHHGCWQLGTKCVLRWGRGPYQRKLGGKTHFHLPAASSVHPKPPVSAGDLASLRLHAFSDACCELVFVGGCDFPVIELFDEFQLGQKNGILGYSRRSHWWRFPYHAESHLENTGRSHCSANLCSFQSAKFSNGRWVLCGFGSEILAGWTTCQRAWRHSLHDKNAHQVTLQLEDLVDVAGSVRDIFFACLFAMGVLIADVPISHSLCLHKGIAWADIRQGVWVLV